MPYRKGRRVVRRKKFPRKKVGGRRRFKKGNKVSKLINRGPTIVPDEYVTCMKYDNELTLVAVNPGDIVDHLFRGNSIFDPDNSIGGGQPAGMAELSAIYGRYRVNASSISLSVLPSGADDQPFQAVLLPTAEPLAPTSGTLTRYMSIPYAKWACSGRYNMRPIRIKHYMTTKKMFVKKAAGADENYAGQASTSTVSGSNPVFQWYYQIFVSDYERDATWSATLMVRMKYYVTFYQRREMLGS